MKSDYFRKNFINFKINLFEDVMGSTKVYLLITDFIFFSI